ncbi:hypothetical protein JCM18902_2233 [Psychrobacter sp. JCM 18902]|nr:hypothetical protein JCM18902_2233 [Psychrobacter sp. JCM 18902]
MLEVIERGEIFIVSPFFDLFFKRYLADFIIFKCLDSEKNKGKHDISPAKQT